MSAIATKRTQRVRAAAAVAAKASPAAKAAASTSSASAQPAAFASADLAESGGQGVVLAAVPHGARVRLATFIVDTQCLGVRKVTLSELPLAVFLNQGLAALHATPVPLGTARAIIENSAAYAAKLGFPLPEGYADALAYFGATPAAAALSFTPGKDGKPHYQQQPGDTDEFAESILRRLEKRPGPGKFTYSLEELSEKWVDGDSDDDPSEEDADSSEAFYDSEDESYGEE